VRIFYSNTSCYLPGICSKVFSLLLIFLFCGTALTAQRQKDFELWGDQAVSINDYYGAALYYKKAFDLDSSQSRITWKYAEALRGFNNYKDAEFITTKFIAKIRDDFFPRDRFG